MSDDLEGGTFGNPDSSLDDWLKDPAAADFIKQKALEHAQALLSYSDDQAGLSSGHPPLGGPLPNGPGDDPALPPTRDVTPPLPTSVPPTSIFGRLGIGQPDTSAPYVMNKGPATGVTPEGSSIPPQEVNLPRSDPRKALVSPLDPEENPHPVAAGTVPIPSDRPITDTDISAKKKKTEKADAISEFAKTIAAVKPTPPPANPAVGTPSVRATTAIQAPQIAQLMSLLSSQAKPSIVDTLGKLLVAGKA